MGFMKGFILAGAFIALTIAFGRNSLQTAIPGLVVLFMFGMVGGKFGLIPGLGYVLAFVAQFLIGGIPLIGSFLMNNVMTWGIGSVVVAVFSGADIFMGEKS
ncbi:MAG: hypothetical protein PHC66_05205 [Candidatus Nanoarchaeia archaeon]|nr:hypothetical protein [Candidatus Nanoarchaeia archaeon]MDD5238910.1 hypothetical protein [Candidatus Nanoarchaeia archaeon]